ncbi:hypothetical protein H8959_017172 [Pygathrix nigripes]
MVGALCGCWFRLGGARPLIPFGPVSLPGYGGRPVARGRAIFTPPLAPGQSPAEEADARAASCVPVPLVPNFFPHCGGQEVLCSFPLPLSWYLLLFLGFGNSAPSKEASTEAGRAALLERALRDLEVQNAVLVSPSLSGHYALPFLMRGHHQLHGFVPIAPTSTQNYTQEQFWAVKTPTLILYGELDHILAPESLRQLRHLPNHSVVKLRNAGHACYLHKPQDFHLVLLAFLDHLP